MSVIRKDEIGLWTACGGYIARPNDGRTSFKEGDKPKTKHFGGSTMCGIGKLEGRSNYKETWTTSGSVYSNKTLNIRCYTFHCSLMYAQHLNPRIKQYFEWFEKTFMENIEKGRLEYHEKRGW